MTATQWCIVGGRASDVFAPDCKYLPTVTDLFVLSVGSGRGGGCMYDTMRAIASVAPACNCMCTPPTTTSLCFVGGWREKGRVVACITLGTQLQASPPTAIACATTRLQLTFVLLEGGGGRGGVACLTLGMQLKVCPRPQLHVHSRDRNYMCTHPTTTDLCFFGGRRERGG